MELTSKTIGGLKICLRALSCRSTVPQTPQLFVCRIHTNSRGIHQQLCFKNCVSVSKFTSQYRHCSSNIVKSPFKDIDIPNKLITDVVWETVDRFPERPAMTHGLTGQTYTYAEIQRLSFRFANSLRKAGFRNGETIAIVLPNCPDSAVILLGALEAELVVTCINHNYTADEMSHQIKNSGTVCIVAGTAQLNTVQGAIKKAEHSTQSNLVRRMIVVDATQPESIPEGVTRYSEMIADGVDQSRSITNRVQTNDLALLPYSSGTIGPTRGVCLSHRNVVANLYQMSAVEGIQVYSPDKSVQDTVLGVLPFFHISGTTVVLLNGLKYGDNIVTLPKFEQDSLTQTIKDKKITLLMVVPPLIMFLGDYPKVTSEHLAYVRQIICGAAPLGAAEVDNIRQKLPASCSVNQVYGMTELSPIAAFPKLPAKNLATVGAPLSNSMAKVINIETGKEVGPYIAGEICFKGPQVMLGYHRNPKATAEVIDCDGWLKTGDIGFYDEANHFYIQDRLKELINVKGFQVPPAELEEVLRTHPAVSDVGVIGIPDARAGEVPVAYIVPAKDKKLTAEQVKEFLAEKVSRHKQVSQVIFTDSIPKSAAGKILRKILREFHKTSHSLV